MATRKDMTAKIVAALQAKTDQTTGDMAEVLGLSVSRAREILSSLVRAGMLTRRHVDQDGTKVFVFGIPEGQAREDLMDTSAKATLEKNIKGITKEVKAKRAAAKPGRIVNSQPELEAKKAAIKERKGTMKWIKRRWVVTIGKKEITLDSHEMADFTLDKIKKF